MGKVAAILILFTLELICKSAFAISIVNFSAYDDFFSPRIVLCKTLLSNEDQKAFAVRLDEVGQPRAPARLYADFKATLLPKLGYSSFAGPDYDVTLVGSSMRSQVSPTLVLSRLKNLLDDYYSQLRALGLEPVHRNNFAIEVTQSSLYGSMKFMSETRPSPETIREYHGVMIKGLFGRVRTIRKQGLGQVVVIPFDENGGPLINRFTLAHELAHDVFSFYNPILDEAVADTLARVLSGDTKAISFNQIIRDIEKPKVETLSDLIPDQKRYHDNSTFLSHLFLMVDQQLGTDATISLIQYLRAQQGRIPLVVNKASRPSDTPHLSLISPTRPKIKDPVRLRRSKAQHIGAVIEFLETFSRQAKMKEIPTLYVEMNDQSEVRNALESSLKVVGQITREWAKESSTFESEHIEAILQKKAI